MTKGYSIGCSKSCPDLLKEQIQKRRQTNIEKYGNDFGKKFIGQALDSYNKKNQTNYTTITQSEEWKKAKKKTDNNSTKAKQTNLQRYGVECVFQYPEIQKQIKKTNIERYGVENAGAASQSIKKQSKRRKERHYTSIKNTSIVPLFSFSEYKGIFTSNDNDNCYSWFCKECAVGFGQKLTQNRTRPSCPLCSKILYGTSKEEKELYEWLTSYIERDEIKRNYVGLIDNTTQEVDLYLPDYSLAIEYNGLYWHTESRTNNKNYHLNKFLECKKKGIQLITIFSHHWKQHKAIIKKMILHKLNLSIDKLYARKCQIKEMSSKQLMSFYNNNHIQGYIPASINIALLYNDEIVAAMSFKKPRTFMNKQYNNNAWELIRFATSTHTIGGASKLLKYFKNNYLYDIIISHSDNCYSDGNLYEQLGFYCDTDVFKPSYGYYHPNGSETIEYRYKFNKKKLIDLGYDRNKSESQIMNELGYEKIWDCGKTTWIYKP